MKTRLKVLCWLFAATYLFVIVHAVVSDFIPGVTAGIKDGWEDVENRQKNKEINKESPDLDFLGRLHVKLIPFGGKDSYPDRIVNKKTGKEVLAESREMLLEVQDLPQQIPWYLYVGNILVVIMSFVILFILVYVPVLSFKTIKSITRDDIFDNNNIRRIRRIGYSLILVFLFSLFYAVVSNVTAEYILSLQNYKIVFPLSGEDIFILTLGVMVLIFAEVLKIATQIKEEQDLTV